MKSDLIGKKFGKLLVLYNRGIDRSGNTTWICLCDCGVITKEISRHCLISRNTLSCGCLNNEIRSKIHTTHGLTYNLNGSKTKLYRVWSSIKERCFKPKCKSYKDYGARGITVCPEWLDYKIFHAWSLENGYREGLSLDRKDNDKNYCPENCRWVTSKVQARNTRTNKIVEVFGEKMCLAEAVEKYSECTYDTVRIRIKRGWNPEKAILTPPLRD